MRGAGSDAPFLPFEMGYLTEEIKAMAENELGETDEIRKESLIEMRRLVKEEPKLVCPDHDMYLLSFLRARKFSVKRAFGVLQNYYHIKKTHTDVYGKPDFELFKKCITDKILNVLPYRDEEGSVIMTVQLQNWNVHDIKFSGFVHGITCALLACVEDPATQVCGIKLIVDVKGIGLDHVRYIHPKYLTLIARGLRNCLPVRFRALHIVNESSFFHYFWNFIRLALSDKIRSRVSFHSTNYEGLHKYFNQALLPTEYSGELEYDNKLWVKKIESMEDLYHEKMKHGYRSRKASRDESSK